MIITVDCNSDNVTIEQGIRKVCCPVKDPNLVIKMLVELLNLMNSETGVTLLKIDEDNRSIVEEW